MVRSLTIEELEHLSLNMIISERRDRVQLGLASADELEALHHAIADGNPKGVILEARFIAYRVVRLDAVQLMLLGHNETEGVPWITSALEQIDGDHVTTASGSLYRIARRGEGEPPIEHLMLLIHQLRRNGMGEILGLPEVWY